MQKATGFSLPHQFQLCRDAARVAGFEIPDECLLHDADSGKNFNRPSLQELLRRAQMGQVSVVYIPKVDRMGRNARDCLEILEVLHRHGVELVLIENAIDTRQPLGKLFFTLLAAFAEWEAVQILERTRSGKLEQLEQLQAAMLPVPGGKNNDPYGYRWVAPSRRGEMGAWERKPEEAKIVLFIFEQMAKGASLEGIAVTLNRRGVPAPRANTWSGPTIRNIVRRKCYIGQMERKIEKKYTFPCPRIVSDELFHLAQKALEENKALSKRNAKHDYLLTGTRDQPLLKCRACHQQGKEHMMGGRWRQRVGEKPYLYYRCQHRNEEGTIRGHSVAATKLDNAVWKAVTDVLQEPHRVLDNIKRLADATSQQTRDLEEELADLETKARENIVAQQRLARLATFGKLSEQVIADQASELEEESSALAARKSLLSVQLHQAREQTLPIQEIESACALLADGLLEATFDRKRWIIHKLVRVVYADKNGWELEGYLPGMSLNGAFDEKGCSTSFLKCTRTNLLFALSGCL